MLNSPEQLTTKEVELNALKKRVEELESERTPEKGKEAIIEDAVKEHIAKSTDNLRADYEYHPSEEEKLNHQAIFDLPQEAHDAKILELLKIAQEKGILNAVKIARQTGNAHLLDDLARALAAALFQTD